MENPKKPQAVHMDDESLERMKLLVTDAPSSLGYAHSRSGAVIKPEDRGTLKGQAIKAMHQQTQRQMDQLAEQIQVLARQYEKLKRRMEISERVYLAQVTVQPRVGQLYHLYSTEDQGDILCLLGPKEWGRSGCPYQAFLASVRLLADHTWEVEEGSY